MTFLFFLLLEGVRLKSSIINWGEYKAQASNRERISFFHSRRDQIQGAYEKAKGVISKGRTFVQS